MLYKAIKEKARQIDDFIDSNKRAFKLPMKEVDIVIRYLFPSCYIRSKGWFKTVFKVCTEEKEVVLKIGKSKSIKKDVDGYKKIPPKVRRKHFARMYWHTKYTILQEYGEEASPTNNEVEELRKIALKYGLGDIKRENIRSFGGKLKIVDFNIEEPGNKKLNFMRDYLKINLT